MDFFNIPRGIFGEEPEKAGEKVIFPIEGNLP